MAKKPQDPKSTAIVPWQEKLEQEAAAAASGEVALSEFVSFKSGILTFNGAQIEGNEMDVIVLDSAYEHAFYGEKGAAGEPIAWPYDADKPRSPGCYAMGRIESELAPLTEGEGVPEFPWGDESGKCDLCPLNQWASDLEGGKGKACKNVRRLTLMDAGALAAGADGILAATTVFAKLPVTSGKNFSQFVIQIANVTKRPPYGVIAKLKVVADARTQFKVLWEFVELVPDALVPAIMAKKEALGDAILFHYPPNEEPAAPARPARPAKYAPQPAAPAKPQKGRK